MKNSRKPEYSNEQHYLLCIAATNGLERIFCRLGIEEKATRNARKALKTFLIREGHLDKRGRNRHIKWDIEASKSLVRIVEFLEKVVITHIKPEPSFGGKWESFPENFPDTYTKHATELQSLLKDFKK